ncbi:D-inositol-3-phosphate glycosyltransferase [mine drainage metagenome]|uniref:D-inositol-3-phosphate glycosyltransferase n=1 Tax=mine drainage metagenome TaxID=410659 RepID=A0A1J5R608_9ZZZZ
MDENTGAETIEFDEERRVLRIGPGREDEIVKPVGLRISIVCLSYAPEATGNAPYTTSLAEGLQAAGHDVRVITAHPHYPEWRIREGYGQWRRREYLNRVEVLRLRHWVPRRPTPARRALAELSFGLRAALTGWGRPEAVLLVSPALLASAVAMLHARAIRAPVGIWIQDLYGAGAFETGTGGAGVARTLASIESRLFRSADGVVAIHDRFRDYLGGQLGVPADRVEVVQNWSHLEVPLQIDRAATRKSLGWGEHDIVVLHAGNQGLKQGLENVVAAARVADRAESNVRFVLLGDGNQRRKLEAAARGLKRIVFMDPLPGTEFQSAMASADVLLVSERSGVAEMSVPSKLTSYFSTGVPVIAVTDAGSATDGEISRSGGGVRVDTEDPAALVALAERLGDDQIWANELGRAGLTYRDRSLSQRAAIERFEGWLRALASGGKFRPRSP